MKSYTVVVLYPEVSEEWVDLTYTAYVEASDLTAAIKKGQKEAMTSQPNESRFTLSSWKVLIVFEGHPKIKYVGSMEGK